MARYRYLAEPEGYAVSGHHKWSAIRRTDTDVRPKPVCETCGHRLYSSSYGWLHWDEDEAWGGCPCVDEDGECIPNDY